MDCCTSDGHQHGAGNSTANPTSTSGGKSPTRFLLPALVVVALVLVFQTFQLISLQRAIQPAAAAGTVSGASTTGAPLPSSLQNLPNMVGGC